MPWWVFLMPFAWFYQGPVQAPAVRYVEPPVYCCAIQPVQLPYVAPIVDGYRPGG